MFSQQNLQINRGSTTANVQGKFVTTIHTYKDDLATVAASKAVFPPYLNEGADQQYLSIGDHMMVLGSDTTHLCKILSLDPFVLGPNLFCPGYQEEIFVTNFFISSSESSNTNISLIKIGNNVTLTFLEGATIPPSGFDDSHMESDTGLPAAYLPPAPVEGWIRVFTTEASKAGMLRINTDGTIFIYKDANTTDLFDGGSDNGFFRTSISYNIITA